MDYQIVIPIYRDLEHIEPNLESLNDWEHLLIVDNSESGWCRKFVARGAKVLHFPQNIGVARSWNLGIKEGKDYTFFVSSSVKWQYGFNELANHLKQMIKEKVPGIEYGLFCQLGWHANAISQKTVEKVGYFDENFYPAYEEDVDYCYRLYLAGLHANIFGQTKGGVIPAVTVNAAPIEIATTIKRAGLPVNFNKLRNYYIGKWNGDHGKEQFTTPFDSGDLGYFPKNTIRQLQKMYDLPLTESEPIPMAPGDIKEDYGL